MANIPQLISVIRKNKLYSQIVEGNFIRLLELDVPTLITKYNSGHREVLETEEFQEFINSTITSQELYDFIRDCEYFVSLKAEILEIVREAQNKIDYDPNRRIEPYPVGFDYINYYETYQDALDTLAIAEQVINSKSTYLLLKLLIKTESTRLEFQERTKVQKALKIEDLKRAELLKLIQQEDNNIGIVRITSSKSETTIKAGTRKDMAISDIIGAPFPADGERPGYSYGPDGDYDMPPYSCHKEFHNENITQFHEEMILTERRKRIGFMMAAGDDVEGYIYRNGIALAITKNELLSAGLIPASVGWKPFRVTLTKPGFYPLKNRFGTKYPLKEQIRIKAKALGFSMK